MAPHAGDGSTEEPVRLDSSPPKDRRWPLLEVCFIGPTKIPGVSMMLTTLEAGVNRLVDGREWAPPPMWYDPVNRLIQVDTATYPLERVHYFKRAKMAITRKAPKLNIDKYTVGKRTVL